MQTLDSAAAKLPEIQQRLKDVVIENRDFEAIIKIYNKPGALFYCDPPYFNAEQYYQGFGPGDHERLKKALESIKGRFVLSYNDTPEIRELYEATTSSPPSAPMTFHPGMALGGPRTKS